MGRRILFVSEAVSIAHVARPTVLADAFADSDDEIHFASSGAYDFCHAGRPWQVHRLQSVPAADFLRRLASPWPLYSESELERYLAADRALIESVQPDVVVHDFRLTMPIAGRLAGVPVLSLCNAHWSPFAPHPPRHSPDSPALRFFGAAMVDPVFRAIWPSIDRVHRRATNRLRRRHGQPAVASLASYYCDGDVVLYADVPELVPLHGAPPSHVYLGPVVWSPALPKPPWWQEAVSEPAPKAYVTLGSTGRTDLLPLIVNACRAQGIATLVATAGRQDFDDRTAAVHAEFRSDLHHRRLRPRDAGLGHFAADFLPGSEAAAVADFVICNGGSATAHQALAQGRPVLGICSNLDQVLTMETIAAAGAGLMIRASEVTATRLDALLARMRGDPALAEGARRIGTAFAARNAGTACRAAIDALLPVRR
jgi:UDP:flavonoid glycosyltransferase YjiC (YdhE family)